MNPKVVKLTKENERDALKVQELQEAMKVRSAKIVEINHTDIIGITDEYDLTPDMLMELIQKMKAGPAPMGLPSTKETEEPT